VGASLLWRSSSSEVTVCLDFAFTLVNREHFAESKGFAASAAVFNAGNAARGSKTFVTVADLLTHRWMNLLKDTKKASLIASPRPRFVDSNGEFLVEVRLSNATSAYVHDFFFPAGVDDALRRGEVYAVQAADPFAYGPFLWCLSASAKAANAPQQHWQPVGRLRRGQHESPNDHPLKARTGQHHQPLLSACLTRRFKASSQSLLCRLAASFTAGVGCHSERREEVVAADESGRAWEPEAAMRDLAFR